MEAKEDDIFLLKLISKGNEQAFKLLFETYFTPLCRFVRLYVKEGTQAEEIVLEVFENVWELRKTLQIQVTVKAYLFQSARNRALNYIRNNEKFVLMNDMSTFDFAETDSKLEEQELLNLIEEAICSLPAKCEEVFRKSRFDNLSNKEIAHEMGVTVKTVEAQITKALKFIREYLGDSYSFLW